MAELIFITGATGFIGSLTAQKALEKGYKLRISVRKEEQIEKLRVVLGAPNDKIEFLVVPDITDPQAYVGKLDGVDYVLHLASPLPGGTDKAALFGPSVNGTTAILIEAEKVSSIKKVVITSSVAALVPMSGPTAAGEISGMLVSPRKWSNRMFRFPPLTKVTCKDINDPRLIIDEDVDCQGETDEETSFQIYHASKLLSSQASWKFMEDESPKFVLVTLHPNFVYGRNLTQTNAEGVAGSTNRMLWQSIMAEDKASILGYVSVGDVADAHVRSLNPEIKNSTSYFLSGPPCSWDDVLEIVKSDYPNAPYKLKPGVQTVNFVGSTEKAEKELGLKWTSLSDVVHEVMDQQLGFLA
ncbi:related to 3-beta hydroxysteroid dehydrogenase/isomerase [Rhynchosporium secalis]|uniref:Related to 3-beta hydroxysteroid dehydrogenase/isomerase n=1 Tax=Rhynchosporium secalis TaxID=38038 RepID=A0A1E1MLI4_RHYSE|nr:related to 3-beta hydroxysteroid dehydrogenase/isomerase [Rhynchosporium secalis]